MSKDIDKSQYILPLDTPIVWLDSFSAFDKLEINEKLYAYYLSKASWIGSLATYIQVSPESGYLFVLLHKLFRNQSPDKLKACALNSGLTEEEVNAFLMYTAGIFANSGNYKGFGDTKIIPGIEPEVFEKILKLSNIWTELEPIWMKLKEVIYDLTNGKTCLGFSPHGISTYISSNMTSDDCKLVQQWMSNNKIGYYNTRCFKTIVNGNFKFEIRLASMETGEVVKSQENGVDYHVTKGDYSQIMGETARALLEAVPFASNDLQANMLREYARSFTTGNLQNHIDGSRLWIKDKGPIIETYIGFIENYRDPAGQRGEFEGFVAMVNKDMTAKFSTLVEEAEKLLTLLPWPPCLEKDKFLRPDFTSLDVLTFAGSGLPVGINIPNYDEIRQVEGFKNVSLGNVLPAAMKSVKREFLSEEDKQFLTDYNFQSFEVQVGLHELLGHGSGKLFKQEEDGSFNFSTETINPINGDSISSWYKANETYDTVFAQIGSAFEECRAEAVGLYLGLEPEILKIFGHEGEKASNIIYTNWLMMAYGGLMSLEMWDPNRGWLQAHSQARFGLLNVMIQSSIAKVEETSPEYLHLSVDRQSILGAGRLAIGNFLLKLQVCKATADINAADTLFRKYTSVEGHWLKKRDIVLAHRKPRRLFVQPNTKIAEDKKSVQFLPYESTPEGLIQSWVERFDDSIEKLYDDIIMLSDADAHHFK